MSHNTNNSSSQSEVFVVRGNSTIYSNNKRHGIKISSKDWKPIQCINCDKRVGYHHKNYLLDHVICSIKCTLEIMKKYPEQFKIQSGEKDE